MDLKKLANEAKAMRDRIGKARGILAVKLEGVDKEEGRTDEWRLAERRKHRAEALAVRSDANALLGQISAAVKQREQIASPWAAMVSAKSVTRSKRFSTDDLTLMNSERDQRKLANALLDAIEQLTDVVTKQGLSQELARVSGKDLADFAEQAQLANNWSLLAAVKREAQTRKGDDRQAAMAAVVDAEAKMELPEDMQTAGKLLDELDDHARVIGDTLAQLEVGDVRELSQPSLQEKVTKITEAEAAAAEAAA